MKFGFKIVFIFLVVSANAQQNKDWIPYLQNHMPTRAFSFNYTKTFDYQISSTSSIDEIGNSSTEINSNRLVNLDLKFPLVRQPNFILTGSFKYFDEEIKFEENGDLLYPLYVSLEDRNLKNLGGSFNALYHLHGNKSLYARSSYSLAGDFYRSDASFAFSKIMKLSLAVGYAVKKNRDTVYGFGLYWGYTFGTPSVYPALLWSKRFPNNFVVEAVLPQSIKTWKQINATFFVFARTKVSGNSYTIRLSNSILDEAESLQLRKSGIIGAVGLTKKMGKWIWLEAEAGYSHNLNFNLTETNFIKESTLPKPNTDYLIESDVKGAPYYGISLFLSPPKEFLDKLKKE